MPDWALLSIRRVNLRLYRTGAETGEKQPSCKCMAGFIHLHQRCAWIFHCWWFCRLSLCNWCFRAQSDRRGLCWFCRHVIHLCTSRLDSQPNVISVAEPEMEEHYISGTLAYRLQRVDQTYRLNPSSIHLMCCFYKFQLFCKKKMDFPFFFLIQLFFVDKHQKGGNCRMVKGISRWIPYMVIKQYSDDVYLQKSWKV